MTFEPRADAPPDIASVPTGDGDTDRGVPTTARGHHSGGDTVPTATGDASPIASGVPTGDGDVSPHDGDTGHGVPTAVSPIGDGVPTVPTTVPDSGGDTLPVSPSVPAEDEHAAVLGDSSTTKKAKIQYAVSVLGTPTRAPKPAEVTDWLAGYGIEVTRSKVYDEVTAYRNDHGISSTGEFPVMTPQELTQTDTGPSGDASPGQRDISGDTVPDSGGDSVPTSQDQGGRDAEVITETEEGRMDQGVSSEEYCDPRTMDLPLVPTAVRDSFDTELATVLATANGNGNGNGNGHTVPASPHGFQGWGHPQGDTSPIVPGTPDGLISTYLGVPTDVPFGDGDASPSGGDTVPTVPTTNHATKGTRPHRVGTPSPSVPTSASPIGDAVPIPVPTEDEVSPSQGTPGGDRAKQLPAWLTGGCYAVALATIPVSVNTSYRFFEEVMRITDRTELVGMAFVMEMALVMCGAGMAYSVKRFGDPGAFRLVVWSICGFAGWTALHMSTSLGEALGRVVLGPVLGAIMLHLALGLVRRTHHHRTGTLARVGRELRERALSRLGLADDARTAAQRIRDRATTHAVQVSLELAQPKLRPWRKRRLLRQLQHALAAAKVADDPMMRQTLLARRKVAHSAEHFAGLDQGSAWVE